ncbi:MAG: YebC/PmpR family DNA-binding transcriptional regulator [Spiroplasma sp.]|nr:YebC/PmpR family DNA-binding transcriptional regulator [Spiroplasma sp.]
MSGHSQFANIKHRKDAQDNKRGKIFQKISKEIYVAVKLFGPNVENNPKLRSILDKARSLNMPKDNINRAISKASNQNDQNNYQEIVYEGFGPGTIALIVHCLTDNKNRTNSNLRGYFNKCHGKLGVSNSVQHLFFKAGVIEFITPLNLDNVLDLVINFEVLDFSKDDQLVQLIVGEQDLSAVIQALIDAKIENFITNEIRNIPFEPTTINDNDLPSYQKLLDLLDNDDDVQLVESNLRVN